MKVRRFVIRLLILVFMARMAYGQTADEIVGKNFQVGKTKTFVGDMLLTLTGEEGKIRERRATMFSELQQNDIDSNLVIRFIYPTDIKGTAFLQIEHSETDDDLWVYIPAMKKVRRIISENKKDSFLGSDFSYGDILPPKPSLYKHKLNGTTLLGGYDCFVVESTPRDDKVRKDYGYGKKISWIRKDNFMEMKVEYYDTSVRLVKTQTTADHRLVVEGDKRWIAIKREMVDHRTNHKSTFSFTKIQVNVPLADDFFSVRTIEKQFGME